MKKRVTAYACVFCVVTVALLAHADNKKDKATKFKGHWTLKCITWSKHSGPHGQGIAVGRDGICVFLKRRPSGSTTKVRGKYDTPFVTVITGQSLAVACHQEPWWKGSISDAKGTYWMWGGGVLVGSGKSNAAHTVAPADYTTSVGVASGGKGLIDWENEGPQPFGSDYEEGGVLMVDENGDGVFDENGDPVWEVPPVLAMRLTSSVSYNGGGVVTYMHTLENFTDIPRTFSFPDITSPEFPSGWLGTLPAFGISSISLTDTPSESVYEQNALGQTLQDNPEGFENTITVRVFVPETRVTTLAEAAVTGATYDPAANMNVVSFVVSDSVEGAVLYRRHDGETELVDELTGPLPSGITLQMEDATFEAGENQYTVMAGVGVNGHRSQEISIVNP